MADDRSRARNRGKSYERRTAKHYGGTRNPQNHLGAADVDADWRTIENKNLAKLPALVVRWMGQAVKGAEVRKKATGQDTLPMVMMKARGQRDNSSLVVLRRRDFDLWFGNESAEVMAAELEESIDD